MDVSGGDAGTALASGAAGAVGDAAAGGVVAGGAAAGAAGAGVAGAGVAGAAGETGAGVGAAGVAGVVLVWASARGAETASPPATAIISANRRRNPLKAILLVSREGPRPDRGDALRRTVSDKPAAIQRGLTQPQSPSPPLRRMKSITVSTPSPDFMLEKT